MGILQEYRFYLIIAVIALAAIIFLFFRTQTSQGYVDFTTELKSNFAQIKGQASDVKSLADVVTLDGAEFRGMNNNQLFGMTLETGSLTGSTIVLSNDLAGVTLPADEGNFKIALLDASVTGTASDFENGYTPSATAAAGDLVMEDIRNAVSPSAKGWNLDANGEIVYVFANADVAKKVMVDYIPEGSLVTVDGEEAGVKVPFIQR